LAYRYFLSIDFNTVYAENVPILFGLGNIAAKILRNLAKFHGQNL